MGQEISVLDLSELFFRMRHHVPYIRLGGWPLPALADGCALHATRTKASSAVGVRRHSKTTWNRLTKLVFGCAL